jgi:hypothetical protein
VVLPFILLVDAKCQEAKAGPSEDTTDLRPPARFSSAISTVTAKEYRKHTVRIFTISQNFPGRNILPTYWHWTTFTRLPCGSLKWAFARAGQAHQTVRMAKQKESKRNEADSCDTASPSGPVREAGGTTGAGNLSPGGADRTGGATSGVDESKAAKRKKLKPSPPK